MTPSTPYPQMPKSTASLERVTHESFSSFILTLINPLRVTKPRNMILPVDSWFPHRCPSTCSCCLVSSRVLQQFSSTVICAHRPSVSAIMHIWAFICIPSSVSQWGSALPTFLDTSSKRFDWICSAQTNR